MFYLFLFFIMSLVALFFAGDYFLYTKIVENSDAPKTDIDYGRNFHIMKGYNLAIKKILG